MEKKLITTAEDFLLKSIFVATRDTETPRRDTGWTAGPLIAFFQSSLLTAVSCQASLLGHQTSGGHYVVFAAITRTVAMFYEVAFKTSYLTVLMLYHKTSSLTATRVKFMAVGDERASCTQKACGRPDPIESVYRPGAVAVLLLSLVVVLIRVVLAGET
ncbi:hypothetical protein RRG08_061380 [Elysia crispata]|uniref:Uncharacterized protein n=1 Tax=Elysia crispata TaxID=231223 RepID=A0AAE1AF79_9GAST|nr:hypothetical protein RRG08_061380 [Elysia crispata]